jgi:hypothetical protein
MLVDFRTGTLAIVLGLISAQGLAMDVSVKRTDVHVDNTIPLYPWKGSCYTGHRSRFAIGPDGRAVFCYVQNPSYYFPTFLTLNTIEKDGRITREALSTHAPAWRFDGWPFDLGFDTRGDLHLVCDRSKYLSGFTWWRRTGGKWRAETVGQGVTYRRSNFALALTPDGRPIVIAVASQPGQPEWKMDRQLVVWTRSAQGKWTSQKPTALKGALNPDFDAAMLPAGVLAVVFRDGDQSPVCALRTAQGVWTRERIEPAPCAYVTAGVSDQGRLLVVYGAALGSKQRNTVRLAARGAAGKWTVRTLAAVPAGRVAGRTDLATRGNKIYVAWHAEHPTRPKDWDWGETFLTVVSGEQIKTAKIGRNLGRPGLTVMPGGRQAFVGVQSGGKDGSDFIMLSVGLDGAEALALKGPSNTRDQQRVQAVRRQIDSGVAEL